MSILSTQRASDQAFQIIDISPIGSNSEASEWLGKAEHVHRQLRPHLPADYIEKMNRVLSHGARMSLAVHEDRVLGVAVYRIYENTASGVHLYVDDLITDECQRSQGVGKALIDHLQGIAKASECERLTLDSGTQRQQAHKFYFREGFVIVALHFLKQLK